MVKAKSIALVMVVVILLTYIYNSSVAVIEAASVPKLSHSSITIRKPDGVKKKITIKGVKASNIKKFRVSSQKYGIAHVVKKTRNTFTVLGNHLGGTKLTVKIYLKKAIKGKKVYKRTLKVLVSNISAKNTPTPKPTLDTAADKVKMYSYEIIPLLNDVCNYFYVKTDNPDPSTFVITDEKSIYSDGSVNISNSSIEYADVKYANAENRRVNGGYIFYGTGTDGGVMRVKSVNRSYYYGITYEDTGISIDCPRLYNMTDYLIYKYTDNSMGFFEKLDAVQRGLEQICLYNGVWVKGDRKKSADTPYYGLTTSPHIDQDFYIESPYENVGTKSLLVSDVYPYILDSLGFPKQMGNVAKRIDASCDVQWSPESHSDIVVTYDARTKEYGGQGIGGNVEVPANMVSTCYLFDNSSSDISQSHTWDQTLSVIRKYEALDIEEDHDPDELTWDAVKKTVKDGAYVRMIVYYNSGWGSDGIGYSYMYDDHGESENIGHFCNSWFDGRYFNSHEYFEKGTKFEDAPTANIVIKDAKIRIPDDGIEYKYNGKPVSESLNYDAVTKTLKGYQVYYYDSNTGEWNAFIKNLIWYTDKENGRTVSKQLVDPDFISDCTLTKSEVASMGIDKNSDIDPTDYYIYDMKSIPGTHS